jgi:hypothetical protein
MEKIYYKKRLIGILIKGKYPNGSVPHTNTNITEEALGILTLKHPKNTLLPPHVHKPARRTTQKLQECFIVQKGKVKLDLYGDDKKHFRTITLKAPEAFLAISGGHGFTVLEDCEMLEVKNGPFKEDKEFI